MSILAAFAAQAAGSLIKTASNRKEEKRRRKAQLDALQPAEEQQRLLDIGPTASEGASFHFAERRALTRLGKQGVLRGSTAPGEVARQLSEVENEFQQRRSQSSLSLAAAKAQIEGESGLPGYGDAFGGTLGDVGSFVALKEGMADAEDDEKDVFKMMLAAGVVDKEKFLKMSDFASKALF